MACASLNSDNTFSVSELSELQDKAKQYILNRGGVTQQCNNFIRDKTVTYFNDILNNKSGIMTPYAKDKHGDPRSPINNVIDGLFFGTDVDFSKTMQSIYGRKRFKISASKLLNDSSRAYFSDFYCVPGKSSPRPHYVTIVLTPSGSAADNICRRRLPSLDLNNNPFFKAELCGSGYQVSVANCQKLFVEVFYTEAIDVQSLVAAGHASLNNVSLASYGSEHRCPRFKDSSCHLCNLHVQSDHLAGMTSQLGLDHDLARMTSQLGLMMSQLGVAYDYDSDCYGVDSDDDYNYGYDFDF